MTRHAFRAILKKHFEVRRKETTHGGKTTHGGYEVDLLKLQNKGFQKKSLWGKIFWSKFLVFLNEQVLRQRHGKCNDTFF